MTKSAIMNICKNRIKLCFYDKSVHIPSILHGDVKYLIKTGVFLLLVIICITPKILDRYFLT